MKFKILFLIYLFFVLIISCENKEIENDYNKSILDVKNKKGFDLYKEQNIQFYKPINWKNQHEAYSEFYFSDSIDKNIFFTIVIDTQFLNIKDFLRNRISLIRTYNDSIYDYSIREMFSKNNEYLEFYYTIKYRSNNYETFNNIFQLNDKILIITYRYLKKNKENSFDNFDIYMRILCSLKYYDKSILDCEAKVDSTENLIIEWVD